MVVQGKKLNFEIRAQSTGEIFVSLHDESESLDQHHFERLLTLREAAELLGMHWKTLEGMARKNRVPAFRIGGRWRFRTSLLNEWLEKGLVRSDQSEVQWKLPAAPREEQEEE